MACNGRGSCKQESGCCDEKGERRKPTNTNTLLLCTKCKEEEPYAPPTHNRNQPNLCVSCFRSSLLAKFKLAVTSHCMISPTDNVLVAYSGGPASRVALQFVHEMQYKGQRNLDASKDRSLPVFGVGVALINESSVSSISSQQVDKAIEEIRSVVSSLAPPAKRLHVVPMENIFSPDFNDGRSRLNELLSIISDTTGKEDLLRHLRMLSLQKIALDNGYNKLVLGLCTSRVASHVISATVKGQGYSLPADIQYVDARWEVPVVLPLRDCLAEELTTLCHLDSLKTQQVFDGSKSGINNLVSAFVTHLLEENPFRERTIVRTAEKLSPFYFNKLPEAYISHCHVPSRIRHKLQNIKLDESIPLEVLCPICSSPLSKTDLQSSRSRLESCQTKGDAFAANCCPSCWFQILPKEPSSMEHFYSLLPHPMISGVKDDGACADQTWMREQIKDCLISDDEDET